MSAPTGMRADEAARRPWLADCAALLLDLDGTIVDSTEAILRGWRSWAATVGVSVGDLADIVHGRAAADTITTLLPGIPVEQVRRHVQQVLAIQENDPAPGRPVAGAAALVGELTAGQWAIVTGCSVRMAAARLAAGGLPRPAVLVADEHVELGKPDPGGYLLAMRRLGIGAADAVAIEDAPAGVAAARAAGIRTIAVTSTHSAAALADADVVVDRLSRILVRQHDGRLLLTVHMGSG
jgi:sugar-phosphatase